MEELLSISLQKVEFEGQVESQVSVVLAKSDYQGLCEKKLTWVVVTRPTSVQKQIVDWSFDETYSDLFFIANLVAKTSSVYTDRKVWPFWSVNLPIKVSKLIIFQLQIFQQKSAGWGLNGRIKTKIYGETKHSLSTYVKINTFSWHLRIQESGNGNKIKSFQTKSSSSKSITVLAGVLREQSNSFREFRTGRSQYK